MPMENLCAASDEIQNYIGKWGTEAGLFDNGWQPMNSYNLLPDVL